ncbi:hypothetical protein [Pseudomonas sp. CGJS7]|uniref:hypothetical protein n=1 Tax=Pseudomonas sp. CGJS7 TaxID=3109348 RepID=UPI00300AA0F7
MDHISTALSDAAWERYEQASATASRYLRGEQLDLVTTADERAVRSFWLDTYLACERVAISETSKRDARTVRIAKEGNRNV